MKFCCASNAAIKNVKIARKKSPFFPNIFNKIAIFLKKYRFLPNLPNSTLQLDLYDMSQTESGVRRRKSYDDLCDLQFVPYEASRLFFKALIDSAITVFCDNLFHGVITR